FFARALAHQRGDIALEVAQAGFSRVAVGDEAQYFVGELEVLVAYTVFLQQPRQHVAPGDLDFFFDCVAQHADDFHAVAERRRNIVEIVGRADEENAGQIERQVQVVVDGIRILRRIEDFQHRRGRITRRSTR